jgi:hypothetical protein
MFIWAEFRLNQDRAKFIHDLNHPTPALSHNRRKSRIYGKRQILMARERYSFWNSRQFTSGDSDQSQFLVGPNGVTGCTVKRRTEVVGDKKDRAPG